MTDFANDPDVKAADALLKHYSFEQGTLTSDQLLDRWLRCYTPCWVRWALIEALYLGRYKAVSVEQILRFWHRRGHAKYHFNSEFERLICHNLPKKLLSFPRSGKQEHHRKTAKPETISFKISPTRDEDTQSTVPEPGAAIDQNQPASLDPSRAIEAVASGIDPSNSFSLQSHQANETLPPVIPFGEPHKPIHEFQPQQVSSEFYTKLTAIARTWKQATQATAAPEAKKH